MSLSETLRAGTRAAARANTKGAPAACGARKKPAPKPGTKAWQRWHDARIHQRVRWGIQAAFFVLSPSLFAAAFNGVKYLFQQIGTGDVIEANSFVLVLAVLLGFTVLFGRFFCGYVCSFGSLGDLVFQLAAPLRRALGLGDKILAPDTRRVAQTCKYAVLVAICAMCFLGTWSAISGYSPWVAYAGLIALSPGNIALVAFVVLALVAVGMAFVGRFFCQFLCPMGAVFSLLPVLPFSALSRKPERCAKRCDRCEQGCPVGIHPDPDEWYGGECISCGRCVDTCPLSNIDMLAVRRSVDAALGEEGAFGGAGKSGAAARDGHSYLPRIRGNELWLTIAKAVLLLFVCWLLGMVEFLPKLS